MEGLHDRYVKLKGNPFLPRPAVAEKLHSNIAPAAIAVGVEPYTIFMQRPAVHFGGLLPTALIITGASRRGQVSHSLRPHAIEQRFPTITVLEYDKLLIHLIHQKSCQRP